MLRSTKNTSRSEIYFQQLTAPALCACHRRSAGMGRRNQEPGTGPHGPSFHQFPQASSNFAAAPLSLHHFHVITSLPRVSMAFHRLLLPRHFASSSFHCLPLPSPSTSSKTLPPPSKGIKDHALVHTLLLSPSQNSVHLTLSSPACPPLPPTSCHLSLCPHILRHTHTPHPPLASSRPSPAPCGSYRDKRVPSRQDP